MSQRLEQVMRDMTGAASPELVETLDGGKVRCRACGHRCLVSPGRTGVCKVRFNVEGELKVPRGYVSGLACDPIEKKPFFHVLPGTEALSFGMLGCDFHCDYCQNWLSSQVLRDPEAEAPVMEVTAEHVVSLARRQGATVIASTYNEPLITSEWAAEIFRLAKPHGLRCAYVSNGNATPEALDYLRPWADLFKVDLKSFREANYRRLGGVLKNVLDTIAGLKERGFWVEIVTLVVPDFNDSIRELREIARFICSVSPDIPWHVTAFYQNYRMRDRDATTVDKLMVAVNVGREEGLRYVYAGNLPGRVADFENTRCFSCGELLVERTGYHIRRNVLGATGSCPRCATPVAGVWA